MATIVGAAMLGGCQARTPAVSDAWLRLNAVPGRPAAGYFTLRGGAAGRTLLGVGSTGFRRAELHTSMADGMRRLPTVVVPADGEARFAPGDRHLMVFEVDPAVKPGARLPLQFTFEGGESALVEARVVGPADPAP